MVEHGITKEQLAELRWRVGAKVPLNVYLGDKAMFQCHTPEDAAMVVAGLNQRLGMLAALPAYRAEDLAGRLENMNSTLMPLYAAHLRAYASAARGEKGAGE